jgi:hypothetical protein
MAAWATARGVGPKFFLEELYPLASVGLVSGLTES